MQNPSPQQPSLKQPYASPSQISLYEQLPTFGAAQEIIQPFSLPQGIAIYPDRRWVRWSTIGIIATFVFALLCFPLVFALNFFTHGSLIEAGDTVPLVIMVTLTALMGAFAERFYAYLPFAHQPLLLINGEGILVGKTPLLSGAFLSWAEIEAIYSFTLSPVFGPTYLCIRPRNIEQFGSGLPRLEHMYRRRFLRVGAPIAIDERLLEISVQAILQQMIFYYTGELYAYHIHLLPGAKDPLWPIW